MPFKALLLLSMAAAVPLLPASQNAPRAAAPAASVSLMMPKSSLALSLSYRQIGIDLQPFLESSAADERALHALRVSALMAQGGMLTADMELRAADRTLPPGRYAVGFTVGKGEAMNFFLAHGEGVMPLPSEAVEPGWTSDRLLLNLVYTARNETHLHWHVGARAGRIVLHPGGVEERGADDDESASPRR